MLFIGDDWAEDHHDVELMDASGRRLAKARLPEGIAGITRLHAMIGTALGDDIDADAAAAQVKIGIETDRGPWVQALVAAGYTVYPVNPLQAARYRERLAVSRAKSDAADAHMLADMVRTDSHQLSPMAGDSADAEAVKVVTRMHKTLIWERTRAVQRLRHALREYFPAALEAFEDLDAADTLQLLAKAPDPASAARLSISQISAALKRARRRDVAAKAASIQAVLRAEHLGQPAVVTTAYAASVRALVALLVTLNEQVKALQGQVEDHFGRHPDAEIILSQPGLGAVLGARVLAEFGDDHDRYATAKARKNYAATSPITRASGKKRTVAARFVHNDRLIDALMTQAFSALKASPGARAYYDRQRARGASYNAALRQLANRLVGILHGCLKTGTVYDEATAWSHHLSKAAA
ncbi:MULTISPECIES: IS110 family transposase [unclassified Solwaraspora]|uniref:IS110 family transposase n=1 Tax=unclassified Solwaraspora TaxID=2627926 RepID=UPI00248D1BDE|nr:MULTISPECIES: IS110 family transposase [unclassified Solwaraspora]WBB95885.1 IS110 family transposase [Solwaraspora sp. WMMA2059]WBB99407.1 IS110 family transposase [Solwaraspora sp. WMMA2059]WBC20211.1 IS110 family transposase [Solwaraspora sp. WMMA2080]WBC22043.1 IS110 family transposase [Solwaraspora sp. WMMA2080]WJK32603.1 IS110 family transposase [Solwaraspora sp. WMMA2065]